MDSLHSHLSEELSRLQDHINGEFVKLLRRLDQVEAIITKLNALVSPPPLVAPPLFDVPSASDASKTSSPSGF